MQAMPLPRRDTTTMARTPLTTSNVTRLRIQLSKGQDEEALTTASRIVVNELANFPRDAKHAKTYMLVAVAFSRNNWSVSGPLEAMKQSASHQRFEMLREEYDRLMQDHPNRIHPFGLYLLELSAPIRRLFRRSPFRIR